MKGERTSRLVVNKKVLETWRYETEPGKFVNDLVLDGIIVWIAVSDRDIMKAEQEEHARMIRGAKS